MRRLSLRIVSALRRGIAGGKLTRRMIVMGVSTRVRVSCKGRVVDEVVGMVGAKSLMGEAREARG